MQRLKLTLSASIRAPASMTNSWDSSSRTTAAVRPAALLALPLVYTALGLNSSTCLHTHTQILVISGENGKSWVFSYTCVTYLRNWLLAVLGSPTMQTLMSPLREVPSMVVLGTPPNSISRMPRFTSSLPAQPVTPFNQQSNASLDNIKRF